MACGDVNTTIGDITTSESCAVGGVKCAYVFKCSDLDLDALAAAYDATTRTLSSLAFIAGFDAPGVLTPQGTTAQSNSTFTDESSQWEYLGQYIFEGRDEANSLAIQALKEACEGLVVVEFGNDCKVKVYGPEWDGESFVKPCEKYKLGRALESTGVKNGDKSRYEIDLSGAQRCESVFLDMTKTEFGTAYVTP